MNHILLHFMLIHNLEFPVHLQVNLSLLFMTVVALIITHYIAHHLVVTKNYITNYHHITPGRTVCIVKMLINHLKIIIILNMILAAFHLVLTPPKTTVCIYFSFLFFTMNFCYHMKA